jgi:hypothetical protein
VRRFVIALILAQPALVHAFSDPALFTHGVDKGGGAGRYFTGSHEDGYACSVCHTGATTKTAFVVDGIPDAPVAGMPYELTVHWVADPQAPQALQLELLTTSGDNPSVAVTPAAMLPAESRCEGKADGAPAVYTVDVGRRRIVGVSDCGASAVTLTFVATGEPIELAIGGVVSDSSGTAEGDQSYELRTMIGQRLVATGGGGCAIGETGAGLAGVLVAIAGLTAARRRRAR